MKLMTRGLALLLTLAIVLGLCSATVWAENEPTSEYEATSHLICEEDLGVTNDELFAYYVQRELDEALGYETPAMWRTAAFESGSAEQILYDGMKAELSSVANGEETSAVLTVDVNASFTKEDLGLTGSFFNGGTLTAETQAAIDSIFHEVYICLLADCPMELYWHDKTGGVKTSYRCSILGDTFVLKTVTYQFCVAKDYSATGTTGTFVTDSSKTSMAVTAIANAKNIVQKHEGKSDLEKLTAYKNEICNLVEYDFAAVESSPSVEGINPWQMVSVFDGNPGTNVVCEGYSKAFQYLCDLTDFKSRNIECHTVNGTMSGGTGAGRHMWNVVTMDDGKNYLVDVTNCDGTAIGAPDKLFMAYTDIADNAHQSYTFRILNTNVVFTYAEDMCDMFCDGYLTLASTAYVEGESVDAQLGDLDGDETITVIDLQLLFEHIQQIKPLDASVLSAADVNDDGTVNIIDQQMLFEHVQGISPLY